MDKDYLTLKRASASRPSGEWGENDYDVLADGVVVGRIVKAAASPEDKPWMWTLLLYHEGRTPTHGYEPTREAAMAAGRYAGTGAAFALTTGRMRWAPVAAPRISHRRLSNHRPLCERAGHLSTGYSVPRSDQQAPVGRCQLASP